MTSKINKERNLWILSNNMFDKAGNNPFSTNEIAIWKMINRKIIMHRCHFDFVNKVLTMLQINRYLFSSYNIFCQSTITIMESTKYDIST